MGNLKGYFILLSFFILYGCEDIYNDGGNSIHGSGNLVSENRVTPECSGIILSGFGNVYLTQDTAQKILIEADDNIIERIVTEANNGSLLIGMKRGNYSDATLNAYISLKAIKTLDVEGSGNIVLKNSIETPEMNSVIDGSGNIYLKGESNYLNAVINGSGNINAENLTAIKCTSIINGSGSCFVNVTEELSAEINGSGSIIYSGNPKHLTTSLSGSGSIVRR